MKLYQNICDFNLKEVLATKFKEIKKEKAKRLWITSCEIAQLTNTSPNRWFREVKYYRKAIERALDEYNKTRSIKSPIGLFTYLLNKYK